MTFVHIQHFFFRLCVIASFLFDVGSSLLVADTSMYKSDNSHRRVLISHRFMN